MQTNHPNQSEESSKVKISKEYLEKLNKYLFSRLVRLETTESAKTRFTLYGGKIQLYDTELLVRFIIENNTQTVMVQVNFEEEYRDYATDYIKIIVLILNEKVLLL